MKKKKVSGSRGRVFGRAAGITVTGFLAVFLFAGCSGEWMETRREIDRIYKAAEKTAEDRAESYSVRRIALTVGKGKIISYTSSALIMDYT